MERPFLFSHLAQFLFVRDDGGGCVLFVSLSIVANATFNSLAG